MYVINWCPESINVTTTATTSAYPGQKYVFLLSFLTKVAISHKKFKVELVLQFWPKSAKIGFVGSLGGKL